MHKTLWKYTGHQDESNLHKLVSCCSTFDQCRRTLYIKFKMSEKEEREGEEEVDVTVEGQEQGSEATGGTGTFKRYLNKLHTCFMG